MSNFKAYESVKATIDQANQEIEKQNGIIDITTKVITYDPLDMATAARSAGYTFRNYWWGTRYYFKSNTAVYKMNHNLDNWTYSLRGSGILGGLVSIDVAAAVAGSNALYFQKMKSHLDYYNNIHHKNYINMDVYFFGNYSIYKV